MYPEYEIKMMMMIFYQYSRYIEKNNLQIQETSAREANCLHLQCIFN